MPATPTRAGGRRSRTALRLLVSVLAGGLGVAAVVLLTLNVVRELRLLNSASSDNVQWTLSQAEVEFLELDIYLGEALRTDRPDLQAVRREFDIFYSRISILSNASIYAPLRYVDSFDQSLRTLRAFLDATVPLIDGPDHTLRQALPMLKSQAIDLRPVVRMLSNSGLDHFARTSDERRRSVSETLIQLAIGVMLLMLMLIALAAYLAALNAQNIRRRTEVQQTSERMKIVTGTSLDAVIVSDDNGRILDFNAAAESIFGHAARDAIGQDLGAMIVPDHHRAAHTAGMERMRAHGEKRVVGKGRVKLEAKRANGQIFPVELAIQSADTENGEIFIAFLRDISHRVEAERQLVKARDRALAGEKAKTDFLATMSHEIRTPLNGLLGNLTLLQDTRLTAQQMRYIHNMNTSGRLLMSHISDVLDITKYDAGKLRLNPVDMNLSQLIQDIVDSQSGAATAQNSVITWGWTGPPAHWIRADRERIQHILINLIGNAVKFTRQGRISVTAEVLDDIGSDPQVRISVRDTGIGIDAEILPHIFDDFMTGDSSYARDVGGTGLGLGIARRFVRALGGDLSVESENGVGSVFHASFPIQPVAAPAPAAESAARGSGTAPLDVLLVEDNEINRMVAREMLAADGHRVVEAHDGREGVTRAARERFDLILMDISMPVMDGRHATRAIRSGEGASARTPIVALTANAMADEQEAFLEDGMNDILTKPLSRDALKAVLAACGAAVTASAPEAEGPKDSAAAEIDSRQIADLRETLGAEALQTLLGRFESEVDTLIGWLAHGTPPGDEIMQRAHKVAGSAATFGAAGLRGALVAVETAAKQRDEEEMAKAIARLGPIWQATRGRIG